MCIAIKFGFTTTLMTPRTARQVSNKINRRIATEYIVGKVLPSKFTESIKFDIPRIFKPRGLKYNQRKLRETGRMTPWVYSGRSKATIPGTARVTATANGGRVQIRAVWSGAAKKKRGGGIARQGFTVQQRAELEAIGDRQAERMARFAERLWDEALKDPQNLRKRKLKG